MIGILNVGAGDTKLVFDPNDREGMERAARVVADMIKRGYAILVQVGEQVFDGKKEPIYRRAKAFDPKTYEYIIAGDPKEEDLDGGSETKAPAATSGRYRGGAKPSDRRIAARSARGVAVGRTAGG